LDSIRDPTCRKVGQYSTRYINLWLHCSAEESEGKSCPGYMPRECADVTESLL